MDPTMKVQAQIRQNAEEISSYLSTMATWQKTIKKKDHDISSRGSAGVRSSSSGSSGSGSGGSRSSGTSAAAQPSAPIRKGAGTVPTVAHSAPEGVGATAASHTYDVGYKKWEQFDVDAALADEVEDDGVVVAASRNGGVVAEAEATFREHSLPTPPPVPPAQLTPKSIIPAATIRQVAPPVVPAARGVFSNTDAEAAERELGNKEFANGNFSAAVKSYTKCLGLKGKNYIAFSNRAMAYLKLKEYNRAESDCTCALSICPTHSKSLLRRATARNALGKHRAALADLLLAQDEDPANKQTRGEIQRTKEMLLSAVNRAPLVRLPVSIEDEVDVVMAGPDLPDLAGGVSSKSE